jgi:hypothetical protein
MYRFYDGSKSDDSEEDSPPNVVPEETRFAENARLDKVILLEHLNKKLWDAINRKDYEEIKNLISKGADVNAKYNNYTDGSMLFSIIIHGEKQDLKIVKLLIDAGANINEKNYGNSLLYWASRSGNLEVVKLLLFKGADVNVVDNDGRTAYDVAKTPEIKFILKKWSPSIAAAALREHHVYHLLDFRDDFNDLDEFMHGPDAKGKKRRKTVRKHKKRRSRRGKK